MLTPPDKGEGCPMIPVGPPKSVAAFAKKVMLILPWYRDVNPLTAFCVAALADKRRTTLALNYGDAYIAHSRNNCADNFLQSDCDWALWIDADMVLPIGNAAWYKTHLRWPECPDEWAGVNAIDRLMSHNLPLVGGVYWGRHPKGPAIYREGAGDLKEAQWARANAPSNVVKPTRWVGTGCLLTHRSVFEAIERKFPRLARGGDGRGGQWFSPSEHNAMDGIDRVISMLTNGPMTGEKALKAADMLTGVAADAKANSPVYCGEDVALCIRAGQAGIQPHVDFGCVCGHANGSIVFGPHNTGR